MINSTGHIPVMLEKAIAGLDIKADGSYCDATFGGGGHTEAILKRLGHSGIVVAFDRDPEAIQRGKRLQDTLNQPEQLHLFHGNFSEISQIWRELELSPADGVLFDLGLSSFQLDTASRGFSFSADGPLDMRFDFSTGQSALDLVNELDERQLADTIWAYGEDRNSRRIAAGIANARRSNLIETTTQLADIVERSVGGRKGSRTHPATRTFQALRIAVNDELGALAAGLEGAVEILAPGGRLVVIAFHSLEDRLVKQFLRRESIDCVCPPEQPICNCDHQATLRVIGKKMTPSKEESSENPRARSAVLRVAERLSEAANS